MNTADLKHRTVYRIGHDVINPARDGRRSARAADHAPKWAAGTLVYAVRDTWTNRERAHWRLTVRGLRGDVYETHDHFGALVEALEPIATLGSVLYGAAKGPASIDAVEILAQLIEDGRVGLGTIEGAVAELERRAAADNDASRPAYLYPTDQE